MPDVFISYSRANKDKVARIAKAVEDAGYEVWWDAELPPHLSYGEVITAKIEGSKAAIVVWSAEAAASEWVRAEADAARNQRKLIQTALGDVMPPMPFNQIQYANLGDWNGEPDHPEWRKVKQSLAMLCGEREAKPADSAPAAAAPVAAAVPLFTGPAPTPPPAPAATAPMGLMGETAAPAPTARSPFDAVPRRGGDNKIPLLVGGGVLALLLAVAGGWYFMSGSTEPTQDAATLVGANDAEGDEAAAGSDDAATGENRADPADSAAADKDSDAEAPAGNNDNAATGNGNAGAGNDRQVAERPASGRGDNDGYNRDVRLLNQSGETIMYLYWSRVEVDYWGDDQLGTSVFPGGNEWNVTVADGTGACNFDMMAITASGREIVRPNVNVCAVYDITFN